MSFDVGEVRERLENERKLTALESSGTILYVAKISYQSDMWFGNC